MKYDIADAISDWNFCGISYTCKVVHLYGSFYAGLTKPLSKRFCDKSYTSIDSRNHASFCVSSSPTALGRRKGRVDKCGVFFEVWIGALRIFLSTRNLLKRNYNVSIKIIFRWWVMKSICNKVLMVRTYNLLQKIESTVEDWRQIESKLDWSLKTDCIHIKLFSIKMQ